ncbi:MAG: histidine kinase [Candidatus Dormibacter sp.]
MSVAVAVQSPVVPDTEPAAQDQSPPSRRVLLLAGVVSVVTPGIAVLLAVSLGVLFYADRAVPENEWIRGLGAVGFAVLVAPMGSLLLRRVPRNPLGWIFSAVAVAAGLIEPLAFLAIHGTFVAHDRAWWTLLSAWLTEPLAVVSVGLLVALVPLLFPEGAVTTRGWRRYRVVVLAFVPLAAIAVAVETFVGIATVPIDNAGGLTSRTQSPSVAIAFLGLLVCSVMSAANLVGRYRRAQGTPRRQLRPFALAVVAIIAVGFIPHIVSNIVLMDPTSLAVSITNAVMVGTFSFLLIAMGVAILKYRLFGIQVLVNRALVYGSLAVFITAVYVVIAVGIGALIGGGGKPNLGLSILATAIVAVGFQPLRERVQKVANRLVYGRRSTPYEVLSQFSARVAESYATDEVMPRMARVLAEGTGAQRADVWLRSGVAWRNAAVWPLDSIPAEAVPVSNGSLPALAGASRLVEVRHQGDLLGALSVTKRGSESLTPVEEKLLSDLAAQAGLVLKNVGLTGDLQARLEELRASRQRLVTAQDEERRRLERNLHDGAQQHLVALKVKLGLVDMLMGRDAEKAKSTLGQLKVDADEALETLRDLARGIYPPLLAEKGLGAALASQARKATVPVIVDPDGIGRYSQDVEAAVYFSVLEALQNVQKYAGASAVTVQLREQDGELRFSVTDDGRGFDMATTPKGSGLVNMADRLEALGGDLELTSVVGSGTTLHGRLAVPAAMVPA